MKQKNKHKSPHKDKKPIVVDCAFCKTHTEPDYKKYDILRQHLDKYARIKPRKKTLNCEKHQRRMAKAVRLAREMALLPPAPTRYVS